ncbi:MAG: DUF1146 domain-containing protein [Firmicutes bacterium]|jgi:uncharacterized membrane protein YwzB|nr:DUF1146 domain-containing protein [Bacillota bacterium]
MLVKLLLYIFFTFVSAFGLSGVNFSGIIKSGKVIESKVLVMVLSFSFGYLLTNFVLDFLNI